MAKNCVRVFLLTTPGVCFGDVFKDMKLKIIIVLVLHRGEVFILNVLFVLSF